MAVKSDYKFKPYTPKNLKLAPTQASLSQQEKTLKSLQAQKQNLNQRLAAEGVDPETLGGEFDNRNLIEKALNLRPNQGLLMDFFETINRPVEAIKGALVSGVEGQNVLEGFWEGISGEEVIRGSEFLKRTTGIEPQTGVGKFIADVGIDMALDPLTYLPAGFFLKGFKKIGGIGSINVTKKGTEIVERTVGNVADIIKRADAGEDSAKALIRKQADIDLLKPNVAIGKGSDAENLTRDTLNSYLKQEGLEGLKDNFVAVSTGAGRTGDGARFSKDIEIYYKAKNDVWVQVGKVEVKDLASKNAWAFKSTIDFNDIKNSGPRVSNIFFSGLRDLKIERNGLNIADVLEDGIKKGTLKSAEANKFLKTLSQTELEQLDGLSKKIFFDDLNASGVTHISVRTSKDKTILMTVADGQKYLKIKRSSFLFDVSGNLSVTAAKGIFNDAGVQIAGDVFSSGSKATKYLKKTGKGILTGADLTSSGRGVFISGIKSQEEAVNILNKIKGQKLNLEGAEFAISDGMLLDDGVLFISGKKARPDSSLIQSGLTLADDVTDEVLEAADQSKNFIDSIMTTTTTKTPAITETITLAGRARAGEFDKFSPLIKRIAVSYKKIETNFKLTFNLTAGLSDEVRDLLKAAYGENLFELERRSARLAEIQQRLIKVDPEAGRYLGEIIEAGAKVVDGKIVKMSRSMGLSDFLDYSLKRLEDGAEIILPSFPDEAAKLNFLKNLNKRYQAAHTTTDDFFEVVVGAKGGTVLRVKGDAKELRELIQDYAQQKLARPIAGSDDYVQFGEKALSKEAQRLLLSQTDLISNYSSLSDEILQELIDVAGFDKLPSELAGQIGYMRHVMSKEAYAGLQRELPGALSLFAKPGSDTLAQRTFLGSAEEINAALREFSNLEMDIFDPNAFNAMEDLIKVAQRKLDQSRVLDIILKGTGVEGDALMKVVDNTQDARAAMSNYDTMFKGFKEDFPALHKNLSPKGQAQLDAFFKSKGLVDGKAIVMNKSAYTVLKGAEKAFVEVDDLVKVYDKFLNTWKGVTLVSPGFHLRNMFGNMFNSYAIGMDTVSQSKYLGVAMRELDEFNKIGKKLAQGLDISPAEQKIFDTARGYFEHGASQTHRGIRDLEQLKEATSAATAKGGKIKTGYNNLLKFNFNVAEKIDDVQRYALYRWSFDKTNDVNKAARTVSEALFDYSHLTPFEKNYMKRIFPFYTFMKNNFIFQAKNIFANPKQYARAGRAYNYAVENLSGYSQDDLPEYATENMWLPLPISVNKNDKEGIAFLKANLPLSDFTEFVENPFRKGVTSLTAPVKLIIEFGAGRDLFTGAPLQAFPGQKNAMEAGTGVLSGLRDQRGNLTISQSPLFQKIINDIGLRTPVNFASAGLDIVDTLAGYQGPKEGLGDFMVRAGIIGVQEADRMELTKLYQDLEKLRNLKKYYEQETGNQLPVLPR
jgi:hypothetical protein